MYDMDKTAFGAFVAQLRKEKGWTQKELAGRLHITDKAVSKWETGASIPDTALLIPLSELLGVTVTELLLCRRQDPQPMEPEAVEDVVKTAIRYSDERPGRAWQEKGRWPLWYALALLAGGLGLWANWVWCQIPPALGAPMLLGAGFGAYFCFFARLTLPEIYDQRAISMVLDGPLRMNMPGLAFNNRNWLHILTVGRVWACAVMASLPLLSLCLGLLCPGLWEAAQLGIILFLTLGGLFVPLYLVGKKYQ